MMDRDELAYKAKIRAEREAYEAKIRAEMEAERAKYLLEQLELNKNDKIKISDFINDIKPLKTKYQFNTSKCINIYKYVSVLFDKVINYIENELG